MAGNASRGADSRCVLANRHGPALRAERLSVVLHLDRAAVVFLSEPGVAAAHDPGIPLIQNFPQLPRVGRVAFRSILSVALLRAVLCAAGVGDFSEGKKAKG